MPAKKPTKMPRKALPKKERTRLRETALSKPITRRRGGATVTYTPKGRKLLTRHPELGQVFRVMKDFADRMTNLPEGETIKFMGMKIKQLSAPVEAQKQRLGGIVHRKIFQIMLPGEKMVFFKQVGVLSPVFATELEASHELKKLGIGANDYYATITTPKGIFLLSKYQALPTLKEILEEKKTGKKLRSELEYEFKRMGEKITAGQAEKWSDLKDFGAKHVFVDLSAPKGKRLIAFDQFLQKL